MKVLTSGMPSTGDITPKEHKEYKRQRYADWLKANAHEVKKN